MTAVIVSIIILSLYCLVIYNFSREWYSALKIRTLLFKFLYVIILVLPGLFLVFMLSEEQHIYSWDYAGYWTKAIYFSELFFEQPFSAIRAVYHSINYDEYNLLPNLLIAPVNGLIGLNFEFYVFSVYLIYFIPLSLIISSLCIRVIDTRYDYLKLALPLFCLIFTPLIIALRFGMVDMIGLIIVFVVLKIVVEKDFLILKNYKAALTIGVLLTLLLFTRRWYIFWAVAYFPTLLILNFVQSIIQKNYKILINSILNLAISGILIVAIVLIFFYPFFEMSVLKDYGDIYTAYQIPLFMQLSGFVRFYGLLLIVLCVIGTVLLLRTNYSSKKLTLFLLISTILIFILFTRINGFAIHHYYLLAPFVVVSCLFGVTAIRTKAEKPALLIFLAIILLNNFSVFIFPVFPASRLLSAIDGRPKFRADISEIQQISDDLAALQNQGNYVYILAGSSLINDDVIRNAKLPNTRYHTALLNTQLVDKRDRFPNSLFWANYVVVTDPVQLARADYQHLVGHLNEQILNGNLKDRYETVKDYTIDGGVKVYLKRKLSVPTLSEIAEIGNFFKEKYPDYPHMYQIDESLAQISSSQKGDAYGGLSFEDGDLIINPGNEKPSEVSFSLDSTKNYGIFFKARIIEGEDVRGECNSAHASEVLLSVYANGELHGQSRLTQQRDSVYDISLSGIQDIRFRVDKVSEGNWCGAFQLADFKIIQN